MPADARTRFVVVGAGPAGTAAATTAASLGAKVTLIEQSIVGGAAHLWDCIPSKTMTATALRIESIRNALKLGLVAQPGTLDPHQLTQRIGQITGDINRSLVDLLTSQGVEIIYGAGRFDSAREIAVGERTIPFDCALISTGSSPRVPDWAAVDGERILTTRDAYDLDVIPEHIVIVGSGVTGVEFVHIFESLGSAVTLVVSRQQILPHQDPEVAAVLEADFLERGVKLLIGARAQSVVSNEGKVAVTCDDGRRVTASHVLLAIGSVPLTGGLGLTEAGVMLTPSSHIVVDQLQRTSVEGIYAAGDCTGQMPLSSVASMQGKIVARHALAQTVAPLELSHVAQAVFTEPEIASVGLEEAVAAMQGRKIRTTKVPFAANSRAVLQGNPRGFAKVISDPATRVVLGGTVVGHRASELIGILALAVQGELKVQTLVDTLMVHPSLSEALTDAAD